MGVHKQYLAQSWQQADEILIYIPNSIQWSIDEIIQQSNVPVSVFATVDELVQAAVRMEHQVANVPLGRPNSVSIPNQHILVMSNGGFDGIHGKLLTQLGKTA
jgi:UDP-N-acetylmuramate: L-alanyl-gamma-D-glutamyl-meso-diaminopimelate ligase